MSCDRPLDAPVLADYWVGALPLSEEEAVEEHLFACDHCGQRLREIIAMAEGIREVVREGSLQMVVSDSFLKRAAEEGLRIRQYAPPAGSSVQCTVTVEDDLLIGRLAADLSGAKRVDLSLCDGEGAELLRMQDIPFAAGADHVSWHQSATFAKAAPSGTMIARLLSVNELNSEELLGEYTFHHTRTLPGPGGW
jgi:hypothetical protein